MANRRPSKTRLTFAQTVRSNPRLRMDLTIPREQEPARDSARESASNPLRMALFYVTLLVAVGVLMVRLLILQVVQDATYVAQAFENRVSRISEPAPRGIIYDRRGVPLVINVPAYNVVITPASLPDNEAQVEAMYRRLSDLLDMPVSVPGSTPQQPCTPGRGIRDLVEEGEGFKPYTPVKIKCDIDKGTALIIREELATMPGVDVVVEPFREYPTRSLTASIVGYMAPIPDPNESEYFKSIYDYYVGLGLEPDRDRIGVSGIEASMQDILAGQNGSMLVERDVAGQVLRVLEVERPTIAGQNVQLTVDARLQAAAEAALTHRIDYINAFLGKTISASGVVIAMNPQTGEILAMVTWPTFDNNRFARVIDYPYYQQLADDPLHPLINHAVSGLYPPGSVFKMVTATGVLEEGVIDPKRQLDDPGKISIKISYAAADPDARTQDFVCWLRSGHGPVDFIRGISESCDVYFYKVGGGWPEDKVEGLGIARLAKWMELFGFGQRTGVELPGEARGLIPSSDWKRLNYGENWSTGDTYNAVFGQGYVLSTPLQMLNAINVIANGGHLYRPTLVDKILDGEGNVVSDPLPDLIRTLPISAENLNLLRTGMRTAVTEGTLEGNIDVYGEVGIPIIDVPEGVTVAGKTGTAEYCDEIAYPKGLCVPGQWPTHSWTALYAPYENPEISVIAFVYNGGEGSKVAAPVASAILRAYFQLNESDSETSAPAPN